MHAHVHLTIKYVVVFYAKKISVFEIENRKLLRQTYQNSRRPEGAGEQLEDQSSCWVVGMLLRSPTRILYSDWH
jgi:hypothetical protein